MGYVQVKKKENVYVLHLLGSDEDMVTVYHNEASHSYELFWYTNPRPSVFVETKVNKGVERKNQKNQNQRLDKVCYQKHSNPLISSINKMFAELVKTKIIEDTSKPNTEDEKLPLVTLVEE
ncbi:MULTISPECIES: hypothetical protein [Aerosakkonema]|uniref:hypothetical protein n=1 Tax=Aerosakkonema TaxID=1246629 RepID=UPI0035B89B87